MCHYCRKYQCECPHLTQPPACKDCTVKWELFADGDINFKTMRIEHCPRHSEANVVELQDRVRGLEEQLRVAESTILAKDLLVDYTDSTANNVLKIANETCERLKAHHEAELAQLREERDARNVLLLALSDNLDKVQTQAIYDGVESVRLHIEGLKEELHAREREVIELKEAFIEACWDMTCMREDRAKEYLEDTLKHVATRDVKAELKEKGGAGN